MEALRSSKTSVTQEKFTLEELISNHNKSTSITGHGTNDIQKLYKVGYGHHDRNYENAIDEHNKQIEHAGHKTNHGNVISEHNKQIEHVGHGTNHGNVISEHNKQIEHIGHGTSHGNVISEHHKQIEHVRHGTNHGNVIIEHNKQIEHVGHGTNHGNVISEHNKQIEHVGHGTNHGNVINEHNKQIEHVGHGTNHGNVISEHNKQIEHVGHGTNHGNAINEHNKQIEHVGHGTNHGNDINDIPRNYPQFQHEEIICYTIHNEYCNDLNQTNPVDQSEKLSTEESNLESEISKEIVDLLDDIWRKTDQSVPDYLEKYSKYGNTWSDSQRWRTIRIFISSTFTDFFAEREVIVKKIIPALQEWAEQFKVRIIECDLRWGVPKNTDFKETISIMMDELDKCIQETNGQPFFLCMLGERYGWIPTRQYVSNDVIEQFDWVYPSSMTHMELIHGALRTLSQNAMFMIRDANSLHGIGDELMSEFKDTSALAKESLKRLKREINDRFPKQTFEYQSRFACIDKDSAKVSFDGLEAFETQVVDFFKKKIQDFLLENEDVSLTSNHKVASRQDIYIQRKSEVLIGREEELKLFSRFLKKDVEDDDVDEGIRVFLVTSKTGMGKSSLLARFAQNLQQENKLCLLNFVSSSEKTTCSRSVLYYFCEELGKMLNLEFPTPRNNLINNYTALKAHFEKLLLRIAKKYPKFPIIIDGIDLFQDNWGRDAEWLPVPSDEIDVRYIISAQTEIRKFHYVREHYKLAGLDRPNQIELVKTYFKRFNKTLDEEQMNVLISIPEAISPLFLIMACEEIRVFGIFEELTKHIRTLPENLSELISKIMERLIKEDETGLVKQCLCFLYCSNGGLREFELRFLLGNYHANEMLPKLHWAKIYRKLKMFLLNTSAGLEEMYDFCHRSVKDVVQTMLLWNENDIIRYHRNLANYFLTCKEDNFRIADSILHHLVKAKMNKELQQYFRKDPRSLRNGHMRRHLAIQKFRCTTRVHPSNEGLYLCLKCDTTKAINPLSFINNRNICILCGTSIEHEMIIDSKINQFDNKIGQNVAFRMINTTLSMTYLDNKQARLCQVHQKQRFLRSNSMQKNCYACGCFFLNNLVFPLFCCNICSMHGNRCVEYAYDADKSHQ